MADIVGVIVRVPLPLVFVVPDVDAVADHDGVTLYVDV